MKTLKSILTIALAVATMPASATTTPVNLTAETAGPGTVIHLAPSSLAELAGVNGVADIQLKDGQTSTNSVLNVAERKTDIAGSPFILSFLLSRGAGPYSQIGKEKGAELAANLRVLYPYTLGVFFLYAYDTKGLQGWSDVKGRKILNGPPRGAAANDSRSVIQLVTGYKADTDYESVRVNWGQAVSTVSDGTVDAAVIPELFPSGRVSRMGAAGAMTAFSIPKDAFESEAMKRFFNSPGSSAWEMPVAQAQKLGENWTIVSEDDTFRGSATVGGDIVHKDMDENLAYKLTKVHIEGLDQIKAKAPFASLAGFGVLNTAQSGMCGMNPLKYHAGAVRAWEEAGYTVPECSKP